MNRFDRSGLRRFRARDAVLAVALIARCCSWSLEGTSIRKAGEQMNPGIGRDADARRRHARRAGSAEELPARRTRATRRRPGSRPNPSLGGRTASRARGRDGRRPDPCRSRLMRSTRRDRRQALRQAPAAHAARHRRLDVDAARLRPRPRCSRPAASSVIRDPHVGTGISNTLLVDWGKLSALQVRKDHPDAVVIFIGANEGFPMPGPEGRPDRMLRRRLGRDLRQPRAPDGRTPTARAARRASTGSRSRRRARRRAADRPRRSTPRSPSAVEPWADQVRVIDTVPIFTPGESYRDAMAVDGRQTIVRQPDGIHLNDAGSSLLAGVVRARIEQDFTH